LINIVNYHLELVENYVFRIIVTISATC